MTLGISEDKICAFFLFSPIDPKVSQDPTSPLGTRQLIFTFLIFFTHTNRKECSLHGPTMMEVKRMAVPLSITLLNSSLWFLNGHVMIVTDGFARKLCSFSLAFFPPGQASRHTIARLKQSKISFFPTQAGAFQATWPTAFRSSRPCIPTASRLVCSANGITGYTISVQSTHWAQKSKRKGHHWGCFLEKIFPRWCCVKAFLGFLTQAQPAV